VDRLICACDKSATEKKLSDAAKNSFTQKWVSNAVGNYRHSGDRHLGGRQGDTSRHPHGMQNGPRGQCTPAPAGSAGQQGDQAPEPRPVQYRKDQFGCYSPCRHIRRRAWRFAARRLGGRLASGAAGSVLSGRLNDLLKQFLAERSERRRSILGHYGAQQRDLSGRFAESARSRSDQDAYGAQWNVAR